MTKSSRRRVSICVREAYGEVYFLLARGPEAVRAEDVASYPLAGADDTLARIPVAVLLGDPQCCSEATAPAASLVGRSQLFADLAQAFSAYLARLVGAVSGEEPSRVEITGPGAAA